MQSQKNTFFGRAIFGKLHIIPISYAISMKVLKEESETQQHIVLWTQCFHSITGTFEDTVWCSESQPGLLVPLGVHTEIREIKKRKSCFILK